MTAGPTGRQGLSMLGDPVHLLPIFANGAAWAWDFKFLIAKTLHVAAYAVLAGLSGWLRVPSRFRWILLFVIMAHAPATELLQLLVEGRTGSLRARITRPALVSRWILKGAGSGSGCVVN